MTEPGLNYQTVGKGSPLLLVHGFGISFHIWELMLPSILPHFLVVMIELPGIGRSPLPEAGKPYLDQAAAGIETVRRKLGIERWQILSYSSGTRVAERYIQLHTDRVERAVFLCPAQFSAWRVAGLRFAAFMDALIPQLGDWVLTGHRLKFLIDLLGFNNKENNFSAHWYREISAQPVDVLKETLRSLAQGGARVFSIPDGVPLKFVWSDEDWIVNAPRAFLPARDCAIHAVHSAPQSAPRQSCDAAIPFLLAGT